MCIWTWWRSSATRFWAWPNNGMRLWGISWVYFVCRRNVNCDWKEDLSTFFSMLSTTIPSTSMYFWRVTLLLISWGSGAHSSCPLTWAGPVTCLDQKQCYGGSSMWLPSLGIKWVLQLLFFILSVGRHHEKNCDGIPRQTIQKEKGPASPHQFQPSLLTHQACEGSLLELSRPRGANQFDPIWIKDKLPGEPYSDCRTLRK